MPRKTKLTHPVSQLRVAANLRRKELAKLIGVEVGTLEAFERQNRRLKPAIIEALYRELGVCPGWIVSGQGPIHTCDGRRYTVKEFLRWREWRERLDEKEEPVVTPVIGYQGRKLGRLFKKDCCPGPHRNMLYGPIESEPKGTGTPRAFQKQLFNQRIGQYASDFMDLARGAVRVALKDPQTAEVKLSEGIAKLRLVFPDAKPERDRLFEKLKNYYLRGGKRRPGFGRFGMASKRLVADVTAASTG